MGVFSLRMSMAIFKLGEYRKFLRGLTELKIVC